MLNSKIYKEISKQEIEKIIIDLYGSKSKLLSAEILKGGLFNTTYLLHTDQDKEGLVLRVGPVNKHLLYNFEKDMMAAEPLFHKMLQDNGIPTSKVLKFSPENAVIDRDYIVIEYLQTIPMNHESLNNVDISYVNEEVGRLTDRIHQIKSDKFGWLRQDNWGLYNKWSDFICAFGAESADKAEEYDLFSKAEIEQFSSIIEANKTVLDQITVPNYVHFDLWQGNVLLSKDKDVYKVAAIIDLDRTIFGDKYWDLSTPWIVNDAFLKGYKNQPEKTAEYKVREHIYKLLFGFLSSYVCLIQYDDKDWFKREKENTLSLLAADINRL